MHIHLSTYIHDHCDTIALQTKRGSHA